MLQREIRLKEVQDATYDDMCRLLNERKLCNVERCTGMGKTTIFLRYIREHPDETVLYFYDTDDIKNKIKTETDGKDVLLMSYQKLFRTAASSVITYLEDKDIDILIFDESHRMGAKTVREKWDPIVSYCIKQGIKVVGGTATDVRADGISVTEQFFNECSVFPYTLGDAVSDGLIQLPWYIAADVTPPSEELMQWASDEDKRILKDPDNLDALLRYTLTVSGQLDNNYAKYIVYYPDIKTVDEVGVKDWKDALNNVYPGFEINIIPITSKHPKNQKYIQSLHKRPNAVDAFLCVDMMSQGHHFDDLTGIVMQRKTSSPVKYTQQIGRCMSVANFNDMFVLDLVGNFINDFRVENPLAAVYRQIAAHQLPGTKVGTDWRDAERARVHMSGHQVRYQLLLDKLRYAAEVSQYKGLSTLCKIYEIHPEVNLADVCKAQKINLGTALRFIAERGKLRDSDYVPEYDPTNNSTYQQRLADKYNNNLR